MPLNHRIEELLLQCLEHARGCELVYDAAIECAIDEDLEDEWEDYLERTERHVEILTEACEALGVDPDATTAGRKIVRQNGDALVMAVKTALADGDAEAAALVACDCVAVAESRNHFNWSLIAECANTLSVEEQAVLVDAYDEVEPEAHEHLERTRRWRRDLWLDYLGVETGPARSQASDSAAEEGRDEGEGKM
jgi:hypothetical protein